MKNSWYDVEAGGAVFDFTLTDEAFYITDRCKYCTTSVTNSIKEVVQKASNLAASRGPVPRSIHYKFIYLDSDEMYTQVYFKNHDINFPVFVPLPTATSFDNALNIVRTKELITN